MITMTFHERKAERKEYYMKYVYGWKQRPCSSCSGTGRYDSDNSPKCWACNGTGKETYKSEVLQNDQQNNNFGWYTVEQLKEWAEGKGVIPKKNGVK